MRVAVLLLSLALAGCGGGGGGGGSSGGSSAALDLSVSTTPANSLLTTPFMSHTKLMVGFSGTDGSADSAPFDMRYLYINSLPFSGYNHTGCMNGTVPIASCSNWWGGWQEENATRGLYASRFVTTAKTRTWNAITRPQIPFFTYYMVLQASGRTEGAASGGEIEALNDSTFLTTYFDDWRFLLQKIGTDQAMLHIEPDLFGYLKLRSSTPSSIAATVATSNPTDCGSGYTNDAAGYAKCMIHMVRLYAPNAKVGLHISPWNSATAGDAASWGTFMNTIGAAQGDFLVADVIDRDADWYRLVQSDSTKAWDVTKMSAFLLWAKTVSQAVGLPVVLWQLPLGNSYQNNTYQHYKDQRVELLFSHIADVRDANVVGMLFGSGETAQTTVESDGGLLIGKTKQHYIGRGGVN